jgi:hypothetical protein
MANGLFTLAWPPATCCHHDQAVGAFLDGLVGKHVVDDVVQHHATPALHRAVHVLARAQAGDDNRHLVLGAQGHVLLQRVVALVHDLVDGKRGRGCLRMRRVVRSQRLGDLGQPVVELGRGPGIESGHRAHHAGLALLDHHLRVADDEQGRPDDRKRQAVQRRWQMGHGRRM